MTCGLVTTDEDVMTPVNIMDDDEVTPKVELHPPPWPSVVAPLAFRPVAYGWLPPGRRLCTLFLVSFLSECSCLLWCLSPVCRTALEVTRSYRVVLVLVVVSRTTLTRSFVFLSEFCFTGEHDQFPTHWMCRSAHAPHYLMGFSEVVCDGVASGLQFVLSVVSSFDLEV